MAETKIRRGYAPTPKPKSEREYCECSRCGTIYPTYHYPTNCPGCDKRRTVKDQHFPDDNYNFETPTVIISTHPSSE